ncbi:MAG: hypothetical protein E6767_15465 [Dysgonomonas sp.]|nr:hypothetical protein [Dysgonomonas sp.]
MAQIKGIDNMSTSELNREIEKGGKFVVYTYVISLIVVSFKRSSDIYFIKSDQFPIRNGWPFLLISLIMGWWGIPWGPIYTLQAFFYAFAGKNVTDEVLEVINQEETQPIPQYNYNTDNPYPINNMVNQDK